LAAIARRVEMPVRFAVVGQESGQRIENLKRPANLRAKSVVIGDLTRF